MKQAVDISFKKFFETKRYELDSGLMNLPSNSTSEHREASSFLSYHQVVDSDSGMPFETLDVKAGSEIILPKSAKFKSKVNWVGTFPKFLGLDDNNNLITEIPEGCVIRVQFFGNSKYKKPRVKYYKTI